MFGTTWPGRKLTVEVPGQARPAGKTLRKPEVAAPTTVTLSATAAPFGIPARPPIPIWRVSPDTSAGPWPATRVSSRRVGVIGRKPLVNQPVTSITTWVAPSQLRIDTWPAVPRPTRTMFGTVCPAVKLRFEFPAQGVPAGNRLTKPADVGSVTVTLSATATAVAGMPATPASCTLRTAPGPSAGPWPGTRVSRIRVGTRGRKAWASVTWAVTSTAAATWAVAGSGAGTTTADPLSTSASATPSHPRGMARPPARPADDHLRCRGYRSRW